MLYIDGTESININKQNCAIINRGVILTKQKYYCTYHPEDGQMIVRNT